LPPVATVDPAEEFATGGADLQGMKINSAFWCRFRILFFVLSFFLAPFWAKASCHNWSWYPCRTLCRDASPYQARDSDSPMCLLGRRHVPGALRAAPWG
jgi:hypothetical protein